VQAPQVRVVVDQLCAPVPGGTGRYTQELVRALHVSQPAGAGLTGVSGRGCLAAAGLPISVHRLGVPRVVLAVLWERGLPPSPAHGGVVHAPTLLLPPTRRAYRLVVTIHDVVPWTHPQTLTPRGVAFHRRMGARAARVADLIVTPTQVVADQVRGYLDPRCEVTAVHLGVTPPRGPLSAAQVGSVAELGAGPPVAARAPMPYILFVGTAEPRKGLEVLVRALAEPVLAGVCLVVVGPSGWGDLSVAKLAADAGVAERVRVVGYVDDPTLERWYAGAGALAMPSRAEGFGLPVVEAMARGVPVVVSDDPALVEVAGGAASVVPIGDVEALAQALGRALTPGRDREQIRAMGRARAALFSWEATALKMWQLYAALDGR
jgi:glycosyltransferase involved in cell wall biosynthesis